MMERLTIEKLDDIKKKHAIIVLPRLVGKQVSLQIINELYLYKKIEDDFGVDLLKLLTAKTVYYMDMDCNRVNGKWRFNEGSLIIRKADQAYYRFSINLNDKSLGLRELDFVGNSHYLDFSDYGKKDKYGGWAFTKEELE